MLQIHSSPDIASDTRYLEPDSRKSFVEPLVGAPIKLTDFVGTLYRRYQQKRLQRQTLNAMGKLNDRMLSDIGWPGRYDPDDH